MQPTPLEQLVHRVNNLLGTIEIQAEVARLDGSLPSHVEALRLIVDAARRTAQDVQRLKAGGNGAAAQAEG